MSSALLILFDFKPIRWNVEFNIFINFIYFSFYSIYRIESGMSSVFSKKFKQWKYYEIEMEEINYSVCTGSVMVNVVPCPT